MDPELANQEEPQEFKCDETHTVDENYDNYVNITLNTDPEAVLSNGNPVHAISIMAALFRRAKNRVDILTERLDQSVYANRLVLHAIIEFLERGGEIRIIVQQWQKDTDQADHLLLKAIGQRKLKDRVLFRVATEKSKAGRLIANFAVSDNGCYRFEPDRAFARAFARFAPSDTSRTLCDAFQELLSGLDNLPAAQVSS